MDASAEAPVEHECEFRERLTEALALLSRIDCEEWLKGSDVGDAVKAFLSAP